MENDQLTAWGMRYREEMRQRYIYENIREMFKELNSNEKFRLLDELTRDQDVREQKYMRISFDSIIEPCPHCGSHDLYFKVKQEWGDGIRVKQNSKWSLKYNVLEYEHFKVPLRATGTFMCGFCKMKYRAVARRVPELYEQWNENARERREW